MPLIDYVPQIDNRRYDDILAEARTRIPRYTPEWTDLNDSDPGMTLVQLFAWMTDMMLYRLGRVPELNYLKFLELLGMELQPARPATAAMTFPVLPSVTEPYIIVPKGTQVSAEDPDGPAPIVFETDRSLIAIAALLDRVQAFNGSTSAYTDYSTRNRVAVQGFSPFGSTATPGSALYLGFEYPEDFPQLELNLWFSIPDAEAARGISCTSPINLFPPADLVWEYWDGALWQPLNLLKDETVAFLRSGHVYLKTPPAGTMQRSTIGAVTEPRYWIRARIETEEYERVPTLLAVRTNTISATQAETVRDEVLGGSDGRPDQIFKLSSAPVLAETLQLEVNEGDGFTVWTEVTDFFGSSSDDRHYVLDRTTGEIRFGNGRFGAIPVGNNDLPTSNIVARQYRHGGGQRGNVRAATITTLVNPIQGIDEASVANLLPASGGGDEESLDDAKLRVPRAIRSRGRAVTVEDFEQLAMEAANIKRAKALPLAHPDFPGVQVPGAVTVIVVPDSLAPNPIPNEGTLRAVCAYLNERRLLTTELYVVPPTYKQVHVSAEIIAEDYADLAEVKTAIEEALLTYFHPLHGGENGTGWPFGGDIFYSRVYGKVSVPGVQRVERLTITLDGTVASECTNVPVDPADLIYSTEHDISVTYSMDS